MVFDHVVGDGSVDRKAKGGTNPRTMLRAAIENLDGKFQLLCANCNHIKRLENREGYSNRTYKRRSAAERDVRPDLRRDPELLALRAEQMRQRWLDPEHRAKMAEVLAKNMKKRLASGEVLFRKKSA